MDDGALQDTGRDAESQCNFLTSLLPPDILRDSSPDVKVRGGNAGGVAQLGERLNGIQEVRGSIPLTSIPEEKAHDRHLAGPINFLSVSVAGFLRE